MYFNRISLNESIMFTIKNLIDMLTIPRADPVYAAEQKLKRVKNEFYSYYDLDDAAEKQLLRTINDFAKENNAIEPVDIERIDRFHHLHIRFRLVGDGTPISNTDFMQFYTLFYRSVFDDQMPSQMSKYNLPYFVDGRYLIFIIFDENSIEQVLMLASSNQLDLQAPVYLVQLPVPRSTFRRGRK